LSGALKLQLTDVDKLGFNYCILSIQIDAVRQEVTQRVKGSAQQSVLRSEHNSETGYDLA
jgi:hypothetical protein